MKLRPNRIKQKLAGGDIACIAVGINNPDDIEHFGQTGFDGLWLEGEHGAPTPAELGNLSRACDLAGVTSVMRVNRNDQGLIYRCLDRGAQGICVPHVNTRAEAENVVAGGKFAPIGKRGLYIGRQGIGADDFLADANDQSLLIILIEDILAVENLDEILTVDHIDVFFVAFSDLAASMGHIGNPSHPEVQSVADEAIARIQAAGRVAGATASNDTVEKYVEAGVRCFLTGVQPWIVAGAEDFCRRAESARP